MTTYKELKGTNIQAVSSDPSNPINGKVWYNTTDNVTKGAVVAATGSFAAGGNMNTARDQTAGAGSYDGALCFGGQPPEPLAIAELYNGTSWTEVADLNTGRLKAGGAGTSSTSILAAAGYSGSTYYGQTESWNGSSWTEVADLALGRSSVGMSGADTTSALVFGGGLPGTNPTANTESWNGSTWTEVNNLNAARRDIGGVGTSTAAICFGGQPTTDKDETESWNGTNWTEVNDLNTGRVDMADIGTVYTSALCASGSPGSGVTASNEQWNGTNWTEVGDLSTARKTMGRAGTTSLGVVPGGQNSSGNAVATTEEWTGAGAVITKTFTDS